MSQEEDKKAAEKTEYAGLDIDTATGNTRAGTLLKNNQSRQLKEDACLNKHKRKGRAYIKEQLTMTAEGESMSEEAVEEKKLCLKYKRKKPIPRGCKNQWNRGTLSQKHKGKSIC